MEGGAQWPSHRPTSHQCLCLAGSSHLHPLRRDAERQRRSRGRELRRPAAPASCVTTAKGSASAGWAAVHNGQRSPGSWSLRSPPPPPSYSAPHVHTYSAHTQRASLYATTLLPSPPHPASPHIGMVRRRAARTGGRRRVWDGGGARCAQAGETVQRSFGGVKMNLFWSLLQRREGLAGYIRVGRASQPWRRRELAAHHGAQRRGLSSHHRTARLSRFCSVERKGNEATPVPPQNGTPCPVPLCSPRAPQPLSRLLSPARPTARA